MPKVVKFKKWFKDQRLNKGLTQKELAKDLGISAVTIWNFETGHSVPKLYNIKAICEYFNVSIEELRKMLEA